MRKKPPWAAVGRLAACEGVSWRVWCRGPGWRGNASSNCGSGGLGAWSCGLAKPFAWRKPQAGTSQIDLQCDIAAQLQSVAHQKENTAPTKSPTVEGG